jgi:hypothetical protein
MVVIGALAVGAIELVWQAARRSIARRNPDYVAAAAHIDD